MQSDLIYDVGLHEGEDAEFYLEKGFRVVGVEASPDLCELAQRRLSRYLEAGRLVILNVAVADTDGPVNFFENEDVSEWGTLFPEWVRRNEKLGTKSHSIVVKGARFEEILGEHGIPYFLKVDIEGADLLCLEGLTVFDSRPAYVSIESNKTDWTQLEHEFALLKSLGYSKFKVIQQENVPRQRCPRPAREGKYVDHRFILGASGLFGEEAPGAWISEARALRLYRKVFWRYRLFGDSGTFHGSAIGRLLMKCLSLKAGWYDTHAKL